METLDEYIARLARMSLRELRLEIRRWGRLLAENVDPHVLDFCEAARGELATRH